MAVSAAPGTGPALAEVPDHEYDFPVEVYRRVVSVHVFRAKDSTDFRGIFPMSSDTQYKSRDHGLPGKIGDREGPGIEFSLREKSSESPAGEEVEPGSTILRTDEPHGSPREIHLPSQMRRIIKRERLLVDRFGGGFSLLVLKLRDGQDYHRASEHLLKTLESRLRFTDETGWLDDEHSRIGVVMHRTPPQGAWKVADDICQAFPAEILPPVCAVYYYPSYPGMEAECLTNADGQPRKEAEGRGVRPMEPLFVRKMPAWKRGLDVVASLIGFLLLSPLLVLTALAVKLTSRGPVFFSQLRTGLAGKPFKIYKFRSMTVDAESKKQLLMAFNEQDGPAFKIQHDPRVTLVGRFLRRTNIDELPQLWNVLKGDMSIVGPRALPCREADACSQWQHMRSDVTPGITCIWQAHGTRDSFDDWVRMDVQYIRSRSLFVDVKLVVQTIPVVLFGRRAGC
jgi:lipopolysaccharide/colanic/teichoic acid biosynthesis glycosyltransferase